MREGITKEQVIEAAEKIFKEGNKPTLRAVRAELGTGSLTTIGQALQEWNTIQKKPETPIREISPSIIQERFEALGNEIWSIALSFANDRLKTEREALEIAREEMEIQMKETIETADDLVLEIEQLKADNDNKTFEIELLKQGEKALTDMLTQETNESIKYKTIASENEKRITDLKEEVMSLRSEITELNKTVNSQHQRETLLSTELKKIETEVDQHEIRHVNEIEALQNTINKLTGDNKVFKETATAEIDRANKAELELAKLQGEHKAMSSQISQMEKIISTFAPPKVNNQNPKPKNTTEKDPK